MHCSTQSLLLAAGFLGSASAHMLLNTPTPFSRSNGNGPLDPSGSNYPCMIGSGPYSGGGDNSFAIGSQQTLQLMGGATHGGGSCQISVTKDNPPTKDSVFKVIHSIVGGCPTRTSAGNAGNDAGAVSSDVYKYTIPNIPAGKYTFAWTWYNKVGNREMYMNCAPLEITGSGGSESVFNGLPDMFKANIQGIGADSCTVPEGIDVVFPNPGQSVERNENHPNFQAPNGQCGASGSGSGSGSGSPSGDREQSTGLPGGVFQTVPTSAPAAPTAAPAPTSEAAADPVTSTVDVTVSATPTAAPVAGGAAAPPPPPASGSGAQSGPCAPEGQWNCVGGTSFQRCASGTWSIVQPMAAGTSCTPGISASIKVVSGRRRAVNFRA